MHSTVELNFETPSGHFVSKALPVINRSMDNEVGHISRDQDPRFSASKYKIERALTKAVSGFNFSLASFAAASKLFSGYKPIANFAPNFGKYIISLASTLNASLALLGGRAGDALTLLIEPLLHFAFKNRNLDLAKNIALAASQVIVANEASLAKPFAGQKINFQNFKNDFLGNLRAVKRISGELLRGGLGAHRRFFTGLSFSEISKKIKLAATAFNLYGAYESIKEGILNPSKIKESFLLFMRRTGLFRFQELFQGDTARDRGHTHYLSAFGLLGSSLLSALFTNKKFTNIIDSGANLLAALSIFGHPDTKRVVPGIFLAFSAFTGALRSLFPGTLFEKLSGSSGLLGSMLHLNRTVQLSQESQFSYAASTISAEGSQEQSQDSKPKLNTSVNYPSPEANCTLIKNREPKILLQEKILREDLRKHPDRVYLYADNVKREGYGSQASEMRGEPNAFAIPTMHTANDDVEAYFSDRDYAENIAKIDAAFAAIPKDRPIVLPIGKAKEGSIKVSIGGGLAYMKQKAFATYQYLQGKLAELVSAPEPVSVV